jgi:phosphoribosyl 1,2-cyclic phosphodiesterase
MVTQRRRTAGIRLFHGEDLNIHLDPGPGALIFSNWAKMNPQKLDAVLVSHCHPDHYNDTEVLIEAMTRITTSRRGHLIAPRSVLRGNKVCGPAVSAYHLNLVEKLSEVSPREEVELGGCIVKATGSLHSDPDTVGFRIKTPDLGDVAYTSDTAYFDGINEYYKDLRLLILCTMRPRGSPLPFHLSVDDSVKLVNEVKPRCVVLTGFGMRMLNIGPKEEADWMEKETGIPTITAEDGMDVVLEDRIECQGRRKGDVKRIINA